MRLALGRHFLDQFEGQGAFAILDEFAQMLTRAGLLRRAGELKNKFRC